MPDNRVSGLAEVVLALAITVAKKDRRFTQPFGNELREVLVRLAAQPEAFEEAFQFVTRFDAALDGYKPDRNRL